MNKTKKLILEAGIRLWHDNPDGVTVRKLAKAINMTHSGVLYHLPKGTTLKDEIANYAVETNDIEIICQLITIRHPAIENMPRDNQIKILNSNI